MKSKFIRAETSFREWKKDPRYVAEYVALDEEFALASVLIEARGKADMTQEEVAEARKIIAAFAKPENASRGVIQLDGRMVERLHAEMAKRTIQIADAIAAMGS